MKLKAPVFWNKPRLTAAPVLLAPFTALTRFLGWKRQRQPSQCLPVPVLCCGGITVGGTGKTPLTLDLIKRLQKRGHTPHVLTRGYGGQSHQNGRVWPTRHTAQQVGDEALLLARLAPTWRGKDRLANAWCAIAEGADCLIMDDGLQDPALHKDLSILTLDGGVGLGNGCLLPAGPLREPLRRLLRRVHHIAVLGPDRCQLLQKPSFSHHSIDQAQFVALAEDLRTLADRRLVAFAGIGRPEKFFDMLRDAGLQLVRGISFPDHHTYTPRDLQKLLTLAKDGSLTLVTTEKDAIKLPNAFRQHIHVLRAELHWSDPQAPERLLDTLLNIPKP